MTLAIEVGSHRYSKAAIEWQPLKQPHGLVVGPTGAGKSNALAVLAEGSASAGATVIILDGKHGGDFDYFRGAANVSISNGPTGVDEQLHRTDQELLGKFERRRQEGVWSVLILDELAALAIPLPGENARDTRARVERLRAVLARIAFLGRAARVHLWVGQQRPDLGDSSGLSGAVRDQLLARIALGQLSPEGWRMVFGSQIESAPQQVGDGWAIGLHGTGSVSPTPISVRAAASR